MKFINLISCLKFIVGSFVLCFMGQALAACTPGVNAGSLTSPLNVSIYAGDDIPIGTVLYSSYNTPGTSFNVACSQQDTGEANTQIKVVSTPMGASFNFSGNPLPGQIYKTNVDGIGVGFVPYFNTGVTLTVDAPFNRTSTQAIANAGYAGWFFGIYAYFIKTGPVAQGAVVDGNSLPTFKFLVGPRLSTPTDEIVSRKFSGSINIVSSTCQPVNKVIDMGDHEKQKLTGKGSTTPWVDSSIELNECPTFNGYFEKNGYQTQTASRNPTGGKRTATTLKISLLPNSGAIDAVKGIMAIDQASPNSASGVGIQLGFGSVSNPTIWNMNQPQSFNPSNNGSSTVTIPMSARYYQTEDFVKGGAADGVLTYVINYY